jgi:hypothetical protein
MEEIKEGQVIKFPKKRKRKKQSKFKKAFKKVIKKTNSSEILTIAYGVVLGDIFYNILIQLFKLVH